MARNKDVGTELLNLACLVVVPVSCGVAAANIVKVRSSALRALVGVVACGLMLAVLVIAWFAIYLGAGGDFHM